MYMGQLQAERRSQYYANAALYWFIVQNHHCSIDTQLLLIFISAE